MLTLSIRFCKQSIDALVLLKVSIKMLLVFQPRHVSWSLNRYSVTVLCKLVKTVPIARALQPLPTIISSTALSS